MRYDKFEKMINLERRVCIWGVDGCEIRFILTCRACHKQGVSVRFDIQQIDFNRIIITQFCFFDVIGYAMR